MMENQKLDILHEIETRLEHSYEIPPRPGARILTDWSDDKLDSICQSLRLPSSTKTLTIVKNGLYHFYNYYFNGVLPEDSSPHEVVFPMIAILMHDNAVGDNKYFFKNDVFAETGFFKLPHVNMTEWDISKIGKCEAPQFKLLPDSREPEKLRKIYLIENTIERIFYRKVAERVIKFNVTEMTNADITLLKLTGFLALLLFRGICKDAIQLAEEMNNKLIEDHIHSLAGWPVANRYEPPCQTCIVGCATDLDKGNRHSSKMFALLLKQWKDIKEQRQSRGLIRQIQKALLNPTAGNGLGLIMLMYTSTEVLGLTFKSLMQHTLTNNSAPSWILLSKFIQRYLSTNTQVQKTYLWARLVDDGYFTEFTAESHPYLAGAFAGIIDYHHGIDCTYKNTWRETLPCHLIKDSAWFKLKRLPAENGYKCGRTAIITLSSKPDVLLIQTSVHQSSRKRVADCSIEDLRKETEVVKFRALNESSDSWGSSAATTATVTTTDKALSSEK